MKKLIDFVKENYKNYDLKVEQNNDVIIITMKKTDREEINKKIDEFNKYVQEIEDDFFTDICDIFNTVSGITVNQLSKILGEGDDLKSITKYTDIFKNVTKEFIKEHISKLENKYLN